MTRDELKALWAELGENHYNHRIGDYANEIPPGPPRPGYDAIDWKVPRVHAMLETHIRGEKKAAAGQPPGVPAPGDDQRGLEPRRLQVHRDLPRHPRPRPARRQDLTSSCTPTRARCSTARTTRTGSSTTNTAWSTAWTAGSTRPTPTAADWISVGGEALFAPLNVLELVESRWGRPQPASDRGERPVDRPGQRRRRSPRLAAGPPKFRPVAQYEAGRPRMIRRYRRLNGRPPRFGGFFADFFGR